MRFLLSWTLPHGESFRAAVTRFLEGGGAPPAGAELIGRWHGGNGKGFPLAEMDDGRAFFLGVAEWKNFMNMGAPPLVEGADGGALLQSLFGCHLRLRIGKPIWAEGSSRLFGPPLTPRWR